VAPNVPGAILCDPRGLFGHIHESHHISGSRHDRLGGTLLFNPGGYHDGGCCAVVVVFLHIAHSTFAFQAAIFL
jgi:Icc-related predicted phosphoesterase